MESAKESCFKYLQSLAGSCPQVSVLGFGSWLLHLLWPQWGGRRRLSLCPWPTSGGERKGKGRKKGRHGGRKAFWPLAATDHLRRSHFLQESIWPFRSAPWHHLVKLRHPKGLLLMEALWGFPAMEGRRQPGLTNNPKGLLGGGGLGSGGLTIKQTKHALWAPGPKGAPQS